ncbi:nijmegen breakage syndrome 1 protein isoform X1 [Canna indica]|uniref:Nijmegen breakage syndrome 1 protein isoform X1 n=1 Tax=Canna indica TaxID=4628 RepID=A0AAQ3QPJ2_9LILI|nr:nijmegen breakage syndrome 1 protein isoform X1 [Canna indica]
MVWCLFPVDPLRGTQKYYIFSKGIYKVGRKDCDVVVQMDTSISRVHAEIVVDKMTSQDLSGSMITGDPSCVNIIDRSKFGTVINKELGTDATRLKKNQVVMLKDGDYITFGTANATFRFSYVPFNIFFHSVNTNPLNPVLQATISAIGAYATSSWSSECSHVLVEKSSPVTLQLIQAVLARKPIVLSDWFKLLADTGICTEIPSCTSYVPDLSLDGTLVKVVEPKFREKILEGYTFVLGSLLMYKFDIVFQSLLELVGAKCVSADEFSSNSQTSADGENYQFILVVPAGTADELSHSRELSSLSRVLDVKLVAVILSGNLDTSIFEQPPYIVSSSHSTDETIVAASDIEMDTATSDHANDTSQPQVAMNKYEGLFSQRSEVKVAVSCDGKENNDSCSTIPTYQKSLDSMNEDGVIKRTAKIEESIVDRHENSDILYSQGLIVRNIMTASPLRSSTKEVVNFKCFRKKETISGNSFKDLFPFSKDPYKESDCEGDKTSQYMKEEKKRKQMEALAEDLFNNNKVRKRAASAGASIYSLFSRK